MASAFWPGAFTICVASRLVTTAAGCALLGAGIPFGVVALVTLHRGFANGKLFTRGVYAWCRHPIYASWIISLVPGTLLLFGTWLFVLVPLMMYFALRLLVRREEEWLESTFGEEYRVYRRRVSAVLPLPPWRP
jgi:protein-S-isoprenylcysteine O-methyltransferase Ste14